MANIQLILHSASVFVEILSAGREFCPYLHNIALVLLHRAVPYSVDSRLRESPIFEASHPAVGGMPFGMFCAFP